MEASIQQVPLVVVNTLDTVVSCKPFEEVDCQNSDLCQWQASDSICEARETFSMPQAILHNESSDYDDTITNKEECEDIRDALTVWDKDSSRCLVVYFLYTPPSSP